MSEQAKNPYEVEAVAEVLEAHAGAADWHCRCGEDFFGGSAAYSIAAHRAHVAEQVVALGVAPSEEGVLPERLWEAARVDEANLSYIADHATEGAGEVALRVVDVERLAEALSWTSGEFTRYNPDAHPDHNRWSWRGDGHGEVVREEFREQARQVIAALGGGA